MNYPDNKLGTVYGGELYNPAQVPAVQKVNLNSPDILANAAVAGGQKVAENVKNILNVAASRFNELRNQENTLQLQAVDADFETQMRYKFSLPNGAEGGFFDADGRPKTETLESFIASWQQKALATNKGYMSPAEEQERALYLQAYNQKVGEKAQAMMLDSVNKRAETAFNEVYNNYMRANDYASAAEAAERAGETGIISPYAAEGKMFDARKNGVIWQTENLLVNGRQGELYALVNSGQLDEYMSPLEQSRMLERGRKYYENSVLNSVANGWGKTGLSGKDVAMKNDPGISGVYTENQINLFHRKMAGEDVSREMELEALNMARSFPPDADYEKFKVFYMDTWQSLGLDKNRLNSYLAEAEEVRKGLATQDVDVKILRKNILDREEILPDKVIADIEGVIIKNREKSSLNPLNWFSSEKFEDVVTHERFEEGGDLRAEAERLGLVKDKDEAKDIALKYIEKKKAFARENLMANVENTFDKWRSGTEEGKKSSPAAQARKYAQILSDLTGKKIEPVNVRAQDTQFNRIYQQQLHKNELFNQSGGRVRPVDYRYAPNIGARERIGSATVDDNLPAGVLLPRRYEGQVTVGKDGVTMTGDHNTFREVPIVGFTDEDTPQFSYKMSQEQSLDPKNPKELDWRVKRAPEHERLMLLQQAKDAAALTTGKTRGKVTATTDIRGYADLPYTPHLKEKMGKLAPLYDTFVSVAKEYDLDPALLVSIAINESGYGTSKAARVQNNVMGVWDNKKKRNRQFSSQAESIRFMARRLKKDYIDQGLKSISEIGELYAPTGKWVTNDPKHLNSGWIPGVTKMMNIIRP